MIRRILKALEEIVLLLDKIAHEQEKQRRVLEQMRADQHNARVMAQTHPPKRP